MNLGLLFSGQGGQHADMLRWLVDEPLPAALIARIGADWRERLAASDSRCARQPYSQVLLTGLALSAWRRVAPGLPPPAGVAGYSVGELAAHACAGVFDDATALELAVQRGEQMERAAATTPGGLAGVTGLAGPAIEALCAGHDVAVAIRNGVDSVVLGGPRPALDAAGNEALRQGARVTPLAVSCASHTRWLAAAVDTFAATLAAVPMRRPGPMVLVSGIAGPISDPMAIRAALAGQIAQTIDWAERMDDVADRGVRCVLEIGPGQALAKMWNQRYPEIPARSVDEFRSATAIAAWVERQLGS